MAQADLRVVPENVGTRPVAIGMGGRRTYSDLRHAAEGLAEKLRHEHSVESAPPLLLCNDRFHFCVGLLAGWLAGTPVALPHARNPGAIATLASQLGPVLRDSAPDAVTPDGIDVRRFDAQGTPARDDTFTLSADTPLVTVYSSGTTGAPRGFSKSARQLLGEAAVLTRVFELTPDDRFLSTVPCQHIYGLLFGVLAPLQAGACFLRETPSAAASIAQMARDASVLVSVPPQWAALQHHGASLAHLRLGLSSGAKLDVTVGKRLCEFNHVTVIEVLGSTETGGIATRRCDGDEPYSPLPGIEVRASTEGRLVLRSAFVDSPHEDYESADQIELLPDGRFRHLGRSDGVVKVGAKRITLQEIEQHARQHPRVHDAAALSAKVEGLRGSEVWLAVASGPADVDNAAAAGHLTPAELRHWLLQRLDQVLVPRRIRVLERLPREDSGKLPRARLEALFAQSPGADDDTPCTPPSA